MSEALRWLRASSRCARLRRRRVCAALGSQYTMQSTQTTRVCCVGRGECAAIERRREAREVCAQTHRRTQQWTGPRAAVCTELRGTAWLHRHAGRGGESRERHARGPARAVFRLSSRKRLRGRARRGGLGGAGRALGALGVDARRARRARQVCKEITSKKEFRFSTLCTGMLGAGSRQREESDVTPRGERSARAKGKGRVGAVATRPMRTMRQGMDGAAGE